MSATNRALPSRGFTLAELVLVIVISAILAAIAVPMFNPAQVQTAAFQDEVKAAVRYAQRQAVAQRRCVFVSATGPQLQLFYGDSSCAITGTALTRLSTGASYALDAPTGVTISASTNPFSFNGRGQPTPLAGVTLSAGGASIVVTAETGYVP